MEESYVDIAVSVLRERISEITHELREGNLDDVEQEELHNESGKLHRAVNELLNLE